MQLGMGRIGRSFLEQYLLLPPTVCRQFSFVALADSGAAVIAEDGLGRETIESLLATKAQGIPLTARADSVPHSSLAPLLADIPDTIIVDMTASDDTLPILLEAAEVGCGVVLANKRPLCANHDVWRRLTRPGLLRYEATVGAGLPVIRTLRYLLETGDGVERVEGAFSGTLGYLFSQMEAGEDFSTALSRAYDEGYTEPDPRDDLGGMDVARKALIIARTLGYELELSDVAVEPLYPHEMASLSVATFLAQAKSLDMGYRARQTEAAGRSKVLRYLALVGEGRVNVGLQSVPKGSPFGALSGADNLVSITSRRYTSPLRIAGPGAGPAVTAAGVLGDLLDLATQMQARNVSSLAP